MSDPSAKVPVEKTGEWVLKEGGWFWVKSAPTVPAMADVTAGMERASSCWLPTQWVACPLVERREYNHDSTVYAFGLPKGQSLNLPVCACVLMRADGRGRKEGGGAEDWDGSDAVRPYTPISSPDLRGRFELLVKRYPGGAASQWLHGLPVGAPVHFKHIRFNVKAQYPFEGKNSFTMIAGGTGVTPMYQALHKLLSTPGDSRPVTLLLGNKTTADILMKEELEAWARESGGRLKVVHVVGERPDQEAPEGWADTDAYTALSGWVDQAKVERYAFPPADDTLVFVCGLPSLYSVMCGPRTEKGVAPGTVLATLGYTDDMVAKL